MVILERWDENDKFLVNGVQLSFLISDIFLLYNLSNIRKVIKINAVTIWYVAQKYLPFEGPTHGELTKLMISLHSCEDISTDFCWMYICIYMYIILLK